jgi:hypothetical protein
MAYYVIKLKANTPQKFPVTGKLLLVDSVGAAAQGVDITITDTQGKDLPTMPLRKAGFRIIEQYEAVTFNATVDADIGVFLSMNDVQLGGMNVINDASNPVNVLFAGTVDPVIGTLNNDDAHAVPVTPQSAALWSVQDKKAGTVTDIAPVAVDDGTVTVKQIVAADVTRRGLRLRNAGLNPFALVSATGTYANAAVIIQPGEIWNENEAPGAAWYGICAAGTVSTVAIQKIS